MERYNIVSSNMSLRYSLGSFLALLVALSVVKEVRLHSLPPEAQKEKIQHSVLMFDEHLDNSSLAVSSPSNTTQPAEVLDGSSMLKKINSENEEDESNDDKSLKVLNSQDQSKRKAQAKHKAKSAPKNKSKTTVENPTEEDNHTTYSTPSVTTELTVNKTTAHSPKLSDLISSESTKSINLPQSTIRKELSKSNTSKPITEVPIVSKEDNKSTTVLEAITTPLRKKYTQVDRITTTTGKTQVLTSTSTSTTPVTRLVISVSTTETPVITAASSTTSATTVPTSGTTVTTVASNIPKQTMKAEVKRKPEVVSSKRGGFLDNSIKINTTNTVIKKNKDNAVNKTSVVNKKNNPDDDSNYANIFGMIDTPDNDKRNIYTVSQNEMIEEALLAEKMIYETETLMGRKKHKIKSSSEEQLQVKPISNKNNSIYAVNPNYKPLKKLEVSMPKPYHKHPDDNSWRNESISQTLGIVFNPKNSSKPLTEVLKSKSEVELSILEKENITSDSPDLRERLEKLTEMRKAKKSKFDKSSSEEDLRSGTWHTGIFENYEDSLSTPKVDLSSPLSKNQQKLLDYYEHDEENEADYFSLANIEINKRKQAKTDARKGSTLSNADYAVSTGQFPPERKPSVQYFPPRPTSDKPARSRDDQDYRFTPGGVEKTTKPSLKVLHEPDISYYDSPPKSNPSNRYNVMKEAYDVYKSDRLEVPYAKDLTGDAEDAEGFKEFPVVYRSSVVHETPEREPRLLASSGASMRQLYLHEARQQKAADRDQPAPDYSLHYYMSGQEETDAERSIDDMAVPVAFL